MKIKPNKQAHFTKYWLEMPAYKGSLPGLLTGCWKMSLGDASVPSQLCPPQSNEDGKRRGGHSQRERICLTIISALPSGTWEQWAPTRASPALLPGRKSRTERRAWRLKGHKPLTIPGKQHLSPPGREELAHQETASLPGVQSAAPPTGSWQAASLSQVAPGAGPKARPNSA